MGKTYYIIRHGETFASKWHTGYGWKIFTASILPEGVPTIEKMGLYLQNKGIDYAARSPLKRCQQTGDIITKYINIEFNSDKRLTEFFWETLGQLRSRIKNFLDEMEQSPHDSILICTHGAVISGIINLLMDQKFGLNQAFRYPEPGVLTIVKDTKLKQINFNEVTPQLQI